MTVCFSVLQCEAGCSLVLALSQAAPCNASVQVKLSKLAINEEQGEGQNCKKALGNPVTLFWENCENMQVCLEVSCQNLPSKGYSD